MTGLTTFLDNVWLAWGSSGVLAIIAFALLFREPLGLNELLIRLDSQAIANQATVIKTQDKLIETQRKIIDRLTQQLRMEGLMPWDEPSDVG